VTSRGIRPLRLFADATEYELFRHGLALTHARDGWRIYAYCLMGTHFHLVAGADPDVMARAMGRRGWYAHELNLSRGRCGPVFDGRYAARPLATEAHACATAVYLAVNPVRAGLRSHPDEWPFASHLAHAGLEPRLPWLEPVDSLGLFVDVGAYRAAVDAAVDRIRPERGSGLLV